MKVSIEIRDEAQQQLVESLRGDKSVKDFVTACALQGLKLFQMQAAQQKSGIPPTAMKFPAAKAELRALDVAAITAALKANDPANPVVIEVGRLVNAYAAELKNYASRNNNTLPRKMRVDAKSPIEKVAFQITVRAINAATDKRTIQEKTAAAS